MKINQFIIGCRKILLFKLSRGGGGGASLKISQMKRNTSTEIAYL